MTENVSTHSRPKAAGFVSLTFQHCLRVSTHSRPKAAGFPHHPRRHQRAVSTHSRPKAAGQLVANCLNNGAVSTHSRPKAAGLLPSHPAGNHRRFNTQPPEGGWVQTKTVMTSLLVFQHTAARRRLEPLLKALLHQVSQPRFR